MISHSEQAELERLRRLLRVTWYERGRKDPEVLTERLQRVYARIQELEAHAH